MLIYDARRAFDFRYLYACSIVMVLLAGITSLDSVVQIMDQTDMLETGWALQFTIKILEQESMQFLVPILCTFPFASSFIDEWNSGMIRHVVSRIGKKQYLSSKAVTTACAGGTVLFAGGFLVFVVAQIIFARMERTLTDMKFYQEGLLELLCLLCRYFSAGAFWAEVSLAISACLNHRFMAGLSPFVIYFLLVIFYERYFSWCSVLYPREWIMPEQEWPLKQWSICLWLLFLAAVVGYIFCRIGERKLQNV